MWRESAVKRMAKQMKSTHIPEIMRPSYIQAFLYKFNTNLYNHPDTKGPEGIGTASASSSWLQRIHAVHRGMSSKRQSELDLDVHPLRLDYLEEAV